MDGMFPVMVSPQVHRSDGFADWWWDNIKGEAWVCDRGFAVTRGQAFAVDMNPRGLFLFQDKSEALLFKLTWGGGSA